MVNEKKRTLENEREGHAPFMRGRFLILFMCLLVAPQPAPSQTASATGKIPLSKELEGLAPGPRIAYLTYLLKTRSNDSEVYFQLGVAFQEDEKADSALHYYTKATEINPRMSKAYVNSGVVLDSQNKRGEALQMFERAAQLDSQDVLAHAHAAYLLFSMSDYENAWVHLSKALAIDSLDPQPHFNLAIFFWESGIFRESLNEWETVVRLAPGSYLARKAEENINLIQQAMTGATGEGIPVPKR
jgi:tetratricopeptide (TPR) repeat protein